MVLRDIVNATKYLRFGDVEIFIPDFFPTGQLPVDGDHGGAIQGHESIRTRMRSQHNDLFGRLMSVRCDYLEWTRSINTSCLTLQLVGKTTVAWDYWRLYDRTMYWV